MPQKPRVRFVARLPSDVHAALKRAAQIQGRSLTDFIVAAAHQAALQTIGQINVIRVSADGQRQFAEALIDPPKPNPALLRTFEHHRRLVGRD